MDAEISVHELARRREAGADLLLIDVREPWEVEICSLPEAQNIPMRALVTSVASLPRDKDIVFVCHSGGRTASVVQYLRGIGLNNVASLAGGLDAWAVEVDPRMTRY